MSRRLHAMRATWLVAAKLGIASRFQGARPRLLLGAAGTSRPPPDRRASVVGDETSCTRHTNVEVQRATGRRMRASSSICMHHPAYPPSLHGDALAPHKLCVRGGLARLNEGLGKRLWRSWEPARRPTAGWRPRASLARGLASCRIDGRRRLGRGDLRRRAVGCARSRAPSRLCVIAGGVTRCSPACCAGRSTVAS